MEETGKPESQHKKGSVLRHLLFWLFVVFAIGEAPFATGELFGSAGQSGVRVSREFRASERPLRYLAPAEPLALTESAESDRIRFKALTGDADDGGSVIFPAPSPVAREGLSALAVPAADQVRRIRTAGFSSRAPPALA